jgi:hypothetical protein
MLTELKLASSLVFNFAFVDLLHIGVGAALHLDSSSHIHLYESTFSDS